MKKIGITQKVIFDNNSKEIRDTLDHNWHDFSRSINSILFPIPNNLKNLNPYLETLNLDGIILSGGNNIGSKNKILFKNKSLEIDDVSKNREITELELFKWAIKNKKPVIGVCKGMQFINSFFNGSQIIIDKLVHVNKSHIINFIDDCMIKIYGNKTSVNSFHNFAIKKIDLPDELIPTSIFEDEVESFRDFNNLINGIMWHPERNYPFNKFDIEFFKKIFFNEGL